MKCPHCGKNIEHVKTAIKEMKHERYEYKLCPFCINPVELRRIEKPERQNAGEGN